MEKRGDRGSKGHSPRGKNSSFRRLAIAPVLEHRYEPRAGREPGG
jgi:hypothetical protein